MKRLKHFLLTGTLVSALVLPPFVGAYAQAPDPERHAPGQRPGGGGGAGSRGGGEGEPRTAQPKGEPRGGETRPGAAERPMRAEPQPGRTGRPEAPGRQAPTKAETPKPETAKPERSKPETPKPETPKAGAPKRAEAPAKLEPRTVPPNREATPERPTPGASSPNKEAPNQPHNGRTPISPSGERNGARPATSGRPGTAPNAIRPGESVPGESGPGKSGPGERGRGETGAGQNRVPPSAPGTALPGQPSGQPLPPNGERKQTGTANPGPNGRPTNAPGAPGSPNKPNGFNNTPNPPNGQRFDNGRNDRGGNSPGGAAALGAAAGFAGGFLAGTGAQRLDQVRRDRQEVREDGRTYIREPGRTIVEDGDRAYIVHDENDRFRDLGYDVRRERRGRDYVEVIDRPEGVQVLTYTTPDGRMLRRVKRLRDGREIVLIDNEYDGRVRPVQDDIVELPPPPLRIPRDRYIVDYNESDPGLIYDTFTAPPLQAPPKRYTLDQIRYSPDVRRYVRSVDINTINFDSGSWIVPGSAAGKLEALATAIKRTIGKDPRTVFLVEGFTDATGNATDNLSLSDRRAQSVAAILSKDFQVPPENLTTQGYGRQNLKENTQGPSAANRRVVVQNITPLLAAGRQSPQ